MIDLERVYRNNDRVGRRHLVLIVSMNAIGLAVVGVRTVDSEPELH
jgi:hypothetical protein